MADERNYYNDSFNSYPGADNEHPNETGAENINQAPVNEGGNYYSQPTETQVNKKIYDDNNVYSSAQFVSDGNLSQQQDGNSDNNLYSYSQPQNSGNDFRYSQNPQFTNQPFQTPPKKKEKGKKGLTVAIIMCLILSGGLGFGGGMLASSIKGNESGVTIQRVSDTTTNATATSSSSSSDLSTAEITNLAADAVVEITTESVVTGSFNQQYIASGAGSGVIITSDGYIVTNNHVIDGATSINVTTRSGDKYTATLVGKDATLDIAVIKIDASNLTVAVTGDSDKIQVGDKAVAIGNPLGTLGGTVTDGIISALNRDVTINNNTMNLLQTNAAINPGNSGGGLFDGKGNLIGIVNAKSEGDEVEGLGFAIPINNVLSAIEDIIANGYVTGRPTAGVTLVDISNQQTAMRYGLSETGVYIQSVTAGGPAATAGLKSGQKITYVDGTEVSTSAEIKAIIQDHSVGDTVEFETSDGTKVNVTLAEETPTDTSSSSSQSQQSNNNNNSNQYGGNSIEDFFSNMF